ncbi:unnamed protein product [Penicillium bialowiezense]
MGLLSFFDVEDDWVYVRYEEPRPGPESPTTAALNILDTDVAKSFFPRFIIAGIRSSFLQVFPRVPPLVPPEEMEAAAKADAALAKYEFPAAIEMYTQALKELPRAVTFYIARSTAYSRLKPEDGGPNYQAALADAEIAVRLAVERGGHELLLNAVMRRAISCFQLGRLGDAEKLFNYVNNGIKAESTEPDLKHKINKYRTSLPSWIAKIEKLKAEIDKDDKKWDVTIEDELGHVQAPTVEEVMAHLEIATAKAPSIPDTPTPVVDEASILKPGPTEVRKDWYQTPSTVSVTLFVRPMTFENVKVDVDIKEKSLVIKFPLRSGEIHDFILDPLFGVVDPEHSSFVIKKAKIEVNMRKKTPGKWNSLVPETVEPGTGSDVRTQPKNWDKVVTALDATQGKKSSSPANPEPSEDDDQDGNVDEFFKKLYASADEDTRRAMVKSFTESGGTSLSTNWSDVGKGPVQPQP